MMKISVALATYNEERNIVACLESVAGLADEIVVVDGSSHDRTVELAKRFTDKIIIKDNPPIFHLNKNVAIDSCTGEWILLLDADERFSPQLTKELVTVASSQSQHDGYFIKRKNLFMGQWMKKGGLYPDPVIRFFRRGKGRLPAQSVHEQVKVDGSVGWLENDLLHLADPTFFRYLTRSNRYTTLSAQELMKQDPGISVWVILKYLLVLAPMRFLTLYVRHRGFEDGFPGFVWALYSSLHIFTSYVKYWEAKHGTGSTGRDSLTEWA